MKSLSARRDFSELRGDKNDPLATMNVEKFCCRRTARADFDKAGAANGTKDLVGRGIGEELSKGADFLVIQNHSPGG